MAGLLQQYGLGLKGVNRVKGPLALEDGELRTAQNAGISLVRARAGIRKRPGLGLLLPGGGDPLLSILPIPFDDWHPGDPVVPLYPPYPPFPGRPYMGLASAVGDTGFTITWDGAWWADFYTLFLSLLEDFSTLVAGYDGLNIGDVTTYIFTGLTPGTDYYYKVVPNNDRGAGTASNTGSQRTTGVAPITGTFVLSYSLAPAPPVVRSLAPAGEITWEWTFDRIALDGGAAAAFSSLPAGFSVTAANFLFGSATRGLGGTGQVFFSVFGGDPEVELTPWVTEDATERLSEPAAVPLPLDLSGSAVYMDLHVLGGNFGVGLYDALALSVTGAYEIVGG